MKTETEWMNAVAEAVMKSAFAGAQPPGIETERVIKAIQADALREAAEIAMNTDWSTQLSPRYTIRDAILAKAKELEKS